MFTPKKSEITKAVKAAEQTTGVRCEVTGYTYKLEDDPLLDDSFVEFHFEVCSVLTGRFVASVSLQAFLPDRRRSWVSRVYA